MSSQANPSSFYSTEKVQTLSYSQKMKKDDALVPNKVNASESALKERHGQNNQRDQPGSSQCSCFKKLKKTYASVRAQVYNQKGISEAKAEKINSGMSEAKAEKITFLNNYQRSAPITPPSGPPAASPWRAGAVPAAEHVPPSYIQPAHIGSNSYRDGRYLNIMKGLIKTPKQKLPIHGYQAKKAAEVVEINDDEILSSSKADLERVQSSDAKITQRKQDFDLNKAPLDCD